MFWKRFWSGAVILAITLVFGILGGMPLIVCLAALSCIAYIEFTQATKVREEGHRFNGLQVIGLVTICCFYCLLIFQDDFLPLPDSLRSWLLETEGIFNHFTIILLLIFSIGVLFMLGAYIFSFPHFNNNQIANAIFGVVYVGVLLSFIYFTRILENGIYLVWIIYISAWVCDTCAYFAGSLLGKHKLTPVLSPKKSVEGAVGGVLGAMIAGGILGYFYYRNISGNLPVILMFMAITGVGAVVSMFGDLAASAIKRNNNIKDYGKIIPGHGGVMDRFDSVFFTAPMVYFLMVLFINIK